MFDTILGLPVHALVVHAVVVLLPLMALVTIAVAFLPRLRAMLPWAAWGMAVADLGMVVIAFVARQSGEALQTRLSRLSGAPVAVDHAALGRNVVWFALALFVASLVVALSRGSDRALPGQVLVVVAGALAVFWTVRTGHTGSQAVWSDLIEQSNAK